EKLPTVKAPAVDASKTADFDPSRAKKPTPESVASGHDTAPATYKTQPSPAPHAEATGAFEQTGDRSADIDATGIAPPDTQAGADDDADFDVKMPSRIIIDEDDSPPTNVPDTLGGYRILKELGHGGMGAVYLAQQVSLDRPVALKVMNPAWGSD